MSSYGEQLEDSVWSDDPEAYSVSDYRPYGAGAAAAANAGTAGVHGTDMYAPLASRPHPGAAGVAGVPRKGNGGGWGWYGGGAWYPDWRLWSVVLCIVVLVAYLVYAHSADERVRQDHEKRYTLHGRCDHLDSMVAALDRGHVLDEAEMVPPPDNVMFARRRHAADTVAGKARDRGANGFPREKVPTQAARRGK